MEGNYIQYLAQQTATVPKGGEAPAGGGMDGGNAGLFGQLYTPIMLGLLFAVMWFFVIRPQRKEEKRKRELLASLKKGDTVITSSGIIGSIASLKDDTVQLKVGDGVRMEFLRSAINTVKESGAVFSAAKDSETEGTDPSGKKKGKKS